MQNPSASPLSLRMRECTPQPVGPECNPVQRLPSSTVCPIATSRVQLQLYTALPEQTRPPCQPTRVAGSCLRSDPPEYINPGASVSTLQSRPADAPAEITVCGCRLSKCVGQRPARDGSSKGQEVRHGCLTSYPDSGGVPGLIPGVHNIELSCAADSPVRSEPRQTDSTRTRRNPRRQLQRFVMRTGSAGRVPR